MLRIKKKQISLLKALYVHFLFRQKTSRFVFSNGNIKFYKYSSDMDSRDVVREIILSDFQNVKDIVKFAEKIKLKRAPIHFA